MPRYIDAEAFLLAEIERCGSQPVVGTCTMDNEYLSIPDAPWIEESMRTGHYRFGWWNQPYEEQDEYEQEDEPDED